MQMNEVPEYVTDTASREPLYKSGMTMSIWEYFHETGLDWHQFTNRTKFRFGKRTSPGVQTFYQVGQAILAGKLDELPDLLAKLNEERMPDRDELSPDQRWGEMIVQMPDFMAKNRRRDLIKLLTRKASGKVLEVMAGFESSIAEAAHITDVTAIDFCREALLRYSHPHRTRILYDIERISTGEKLDFLNPASINTVSITFGINYLSDPSAFYRECSRLLTSGGNVLVFGGTASGYQDMVKSPFDPEKAGVQMTQAGLVATVKQLTYLKSPNKLGEYYLIEGTKI